MSFRFFRYLCFVLSLFSLNKALILSQESSVYTNYYLNYFIVNPAATGIDYYPVADIAVRQQWVNFPDAPSALLLSGQVRIGKRDFYDTKGLINKNPFKMSGRVGLGASVFSDKEGPQAYTGGIISYAYHIPLSGKSTLSFGLSALVSYYEFNSGILNPGQHDDPYLLNGNDNHFSANFNFGLFFQKNKLFGGLSVDKILPDFVSVGNEKKYQPSIFLSGGYNYHLITNIIDFQPSVIIKKIAGDFPTLDIHAKFYIKKLNWAAFSYSTEGKLTFRLGIRIFKVYYACYGYEYTLGEISNYSFGSHEIHLGINIGANGIDRSRY
jgi:type IX secretion system PorP/SprF family membrane protein